MDYFFLVKHFIGTRVETRRTAPCRAALHQVLALLLLQRCEHGGVAFRERRLRGTNILKHHLHGERDARHHRGAPATPDDVCGVCGGGGLGGVKGFVAFVGRGRSRGEANVVAMNDYSFLRAEKRCRFVATAGCTLRGAAAAWPALRRRRGVDRRGARRDRCYGEIHFVEGRTCRREWGRRSAGVAASIASVAAKSHVIQKKATLARERRFPIPTCRSRSRPRSRRR
jgi:hypothetical protein